MALLESTGGEGRLLVCRILEHRARVGRTGNQEKSDTKLFISYDMFIVPLIDGIIIDRHITRHIAHSIFLVHAFIPNFGWELGAGPCGLGLIMLHNKNHLHSNDGLLTLSKIKAQLKHGLTKTASHCAVTTQQPSSSSLLLPFSSLLLSLRSKAAAKSPSDVTYSSPLRAAAACSSQTCCTRARAFFVI